MSSSEETSKDEVRKLLVVRRDRQVSVCDLRQSTTCHASLPLRLLRCTYRGPGKATKGPPSLCNLPSSSPPVSPWTRSAAFEQHGYCCIWVRRPCQGINIVVSVKTINSISGCFLQVTCILMLRLSLGCGTFYSLRCC